jgi:hypothetical protein
MHKLPETSFVYPCTDLLKTRMESEKETDLQVHAISITSRDHFPAFLWCECHRFIAKHMETALCGSDDLFAV